MLSTGANIWGFYEKLNAINFRRIDARMALINWILLLIFFVVYILSFVVVGIFSFLAQICVHEPAPNDIIIFCEHFNSFIWQPRATATNMSECPHICINMYKYVYVYLYIIFITK